MVVFVGYDVRRLLEKSYKTAVVWRPGKNNLYTHRYLSIWTNKKSSSRLPTDRFSLYVYMGVWFCSEVSEAVEVRSIGVSFRTELQEKIASRRLVIEHLEKVRETSGWLMRLNRDQEDDVSLLRLLDTFVHRMYEIVRKREKDVRELDY
uniref:Uncharacterized protein n=1 Tax=Tanacetum cinerariifolium TaxID=118510 RepID=A0A6L2L685_TANCI|nr:hypothetical protein [Tanacetum cinerariifolium]